VNQTVIL